MQTDWLIVRRLASELDRSVRGERIREAGRLSDGRFGLRLAAATLVIDAFGDTPIVTLEGAHVLDQTAGWVRAIAVALEGLRIERVRARRGDRLIAFECAARSRFGVASGYRLVAELVPRFGNILLLKDDTIVSAAKEFTRAQNARRSIAVGDAYEPPPLAAAEPEPGALDALARALVGERETAEDAVVRALRTAVPLVPRLVAQSLATEARALVRSGGAAHVVAERSVARARALVDATDGEPGALGDVFCYWTQERLTAASVVPLAQFAELRHTREASLLRILSAALGNASHERAERRFVERRRALGVRLAKRRDAIAAERDALERERDDTDSRDDLRRSGESLYAHIDAVPPGAASFVPPSDPERTIVLDPERDAKANAAAIFKRYRKAVAKLGFIDARLAVLAQDADLAAELAWELERSDADTLADVAESLDRLERRTPPAHRGTPARRKPLAIRIADDALIYVGRSPRENVDVTFRLARPDDVWFHTRNTPGAHVVLHLDGDREPAPQELERAAALAAYHSKARASDKVAVDYTERKYVRRRQNAPAGLVWYTNARTLTVAPDAEPAAATR